MTKLFFLFATLFCASQSIFSGSDTALGQKLLDESKKLVDSNFKTQVLTAMIDLINAGADVNVQDESGNTALYYLAFLPCDSDQQVDEVFKHFAKAGAQTLIRKGQEFSIFASVGGQCDLERLLKNGLKPDHDDIEGLKQAIYIQHAGNVQLFLDAGVSVNVTDKAGGTPLMRAVQAHNVDAVDAILPRMSAIDQKETSSGETALHFAFWGIGVKPGEENRSTKNKIIRSLLEKGVSINVRDKRGATPLIYAINEQDALDTEPDADLIDFIIAEGADPLQKDMYGLSALHYAQHKGLHKLIAAILFALETYQPEKLSAAQKEARISLDEALTKKSFYDYIKDYSITICISVRNALALFGVGASVYLYIKGSKPSKRGRTL